jgi:hypothetical protein
MTRKYYGRTSTATSKAGAASCQESSQGNSGSGNSSQGNDIAKTASGRNSSWGRNFDDGRR